VYLMGAYEELLDVIQEVMPRARRLGTLFVPAEVNTVFHRDRMLEATRKRNFTLATVAANTSSDMPDASLSLASLPLDAIAQLPGNLTSAAFPSLAQAGQRARLPIFAFATSQARGGAMIAVARDYDDGGRESAQMAARVMRGEAIATMPFQEVKTTKITVNLDVARAAGITIPPALIARAHTVLGGK
jgi:putative ABC transport system substrate-binding protein